jgi:CCR4-NOT transcriptional regulation complex NOT5 subunit
MAKAKALPTDPKVLASMLAALKDKEAKLEADLAIKEHPELEHGVAAVVMRLVEARKAKAKLDTVQPSDAKKRERLQMLHTRLEHLRRQVEATEAALADEEGGAKYDGMRVKLETAVVGLQEEFDKWLPAFQEHGVRLRELLPSLNDFIPREGE